MGKSFCLRFSSLSCRSINIWQIDYLNGACSLSWQQNKYFFCVLRLFFILTVYTWCYFFLLKIYEYERSKAIAGCQLHTVGEYRHLKLHVKLLLASILWFQFIIQIKLQSTNIFTFFFILFKHWAFNWDQNRIRRGKAKVF
jgi:hypothetical protein